MAKFQSKMAVASSVMTIKTEETVIDGDMAYSRGSYVQVSTSKADGSRMRLVGKFLDILARQADRSGFALVDPSQNFLDAKAQTKTAILFLCFLFSSLTHLLCVSVPKTPILFSSSSVPPWLSYIF